MGFYPIGNKHMVEQKSNRMLECLSHLLSSIATDQVPCDSEG
jgi:hypothetical protein